MSNRTPGRPPAPVRAAEPPPRPAPQGAGTAPLEVGPVAHLAIDRAEPPEHLFRRLLSAYLAGARGFELVERPRLSLRTRDVVREFCRRTRRPELTRDDGSRLLLVAQGPGGMPEVEQALLRLGAEVVHFHREALESWERLPLRDDGAWERRDDDIDREAWYLERSITLQEPPPRERARAEMTAWTIARSLERIGDHAVTLGEVGPRLAELGSETSPVRDLRQVHRQAMAHLEEVLREATDPARVNDLLDVGEALLEGCRARSEHVLPAVSDGTMSPAAAAAVSRAFEAIARTIAYSQDIAQAYLDRAIPATSWLPAASAAVPAA